MPPVGWNPTPETRARWQAHQDRLTANRPRVFWTRVEKGSVCWVWVGQRTARGYGWFSIRSRPMLAHRYAWELMHGPIPDGMQVCHHCDNPSCVRPDHLFLGTQSDNMRDMVAKGRGHWNPRRKLMDWQVQQIRALRIRGWTCESIAASFGVSASRVSAISLDPARERQPHGADKTHCKNGHPFTPENTYVHPPTSPRAGRRTCRECHRTSTRAYYARRAS